MAEDPWWDTAGPDGGDRVVVAMRDGRDRELLADWLDAVSHYEVRAVSTPDAVPEEYDLCIVDDRVHEAFAGTIRARERAADSVYLPHMLLVPGGNNGTDDEKRVSTFAEDLVFDDVVEMPVDKPALRRRIENLLRSRRASRHLRDRKHQYRRLVERTPEPIVLVRDGSVAYANDAARELLEAEDEDVLTGSEVTAFVAAEDGATLRDLLREVTDTDTEGATGFVEMSFRTATGTTVPVEVTGVTVTYEGDPVTQLVVRDLTEQKKREQQLTLFGRAIEAAAQGITIADAQQDDEPLIYANEAFERITGYDADEILGRNCRLLQGEHTAEEPVAEMRAAIDDRRPVSVELLNYRKDGSPFWNRVDIVPVRDNEGTVTHFLGLQRDVTDRKKQEERLTVLDRILRHNLRNRMTVIRGNAEQLLEETDSDSARRILNASDNLLNISEQVRAFRGTILPASESYETLDLVSVVEEAVAPLRERRPDPDIALDLSDSAVVRAHNTLPLGIRNLLTLAAGGDGCDIEVRVRSDGDDVTLELTDRARSLSVDALETVASGVETPLAHAEGLELWLIRWAVEQSRGEFTAAIDDDAAVVRMAFPHPDPDPYSQRTDSR